MTAPFLIPFKQIDVFTQGSFMGNPVAVVLDGNSLTTTQMQKIANWIHLSETTFVCKAENKTADYRLRIFSPQHELPFAGHPTIGSAYAVLKSGLSPKHDNYLVQECGSGLVKIYLSKNQLFLTLPEAKKEKISHDIIIKISQALGISVSDIQYGEKIDVGVIWYTLQLKNAEQVLKIKPDMKNLANITNESASGVTIFGEYPQSNKERFEVRSFAPSEGADEDPVCGSGNGCVAVSVRDRKLLGNRTEYVASQGTCLGRKGQIYVKIPQAGQILIGGYATACIEGNIQV